MTATVVLEEEYHVRVGENALVAALAFAVFWANFGAAWLLSSRRVPEFAGFTPAQKADWCSRVNSTLHAVVVIAGVAYALADITWDDEFLPLSSIRSASFVFSIAIGYFLCDLIIIIVWPVPMQLVFIIHHLVAVVPYLVNNFVSCCAASQFGLLLFLLVELATLPLNARGFMESVGHIESKNYSRSIYVTYVVWGVSRMLLPVFLLYDVWAYAYPSDRNHDTCLYTNLVGAHIIALFCIGVFFFVHTPEILARRRKRHEARSDKAGVVQGDDADDSRDETETSQPPKSCLGSLSITLSRHKDDAVVDDSYDDIELGVLPRSARAAS